MEITTEPKSSPSAGVDAAVQFLKSEGDDGTSNVPSVDEKALLRKIDWMIVPLLWACYNLQYLDKILINYASIMGLFEDTNIDTDQFSYLALAFYVTYLVFEIPTGYLMQRLPTAKYLGANLILWGLMVTLNCAAKNFGGLVTLRILLGCFEAAVAPALILITGMWYKKHEQPTRVGIWYMGSSTGSIIGALTSFGLLHYTSNTTFHSWQVMFLIFGLITIATGIIVVLWLPDNPMTSRLSRSEKLLVIERLRENQTGIENKTWKFPQFFETFRDPQTYLISVVTIASSVPNGAVSSFQALIIQAIGFTDKETQLLAIPGATVGLLSTVIACFYASRFRVRGVFVISMLIPGLLGGCLLAFLDNTYPAGKVAGAYLTHFIGSALPLIYSWVSANYAGHTKKVTMNAVVLMSFCLGNILGPLTFKQKDAPQYVPAKIAIVVTMAIAIVMTLVLMFYYSVENKKRDKARDEGEEQSVADFLDMTDVENRSFRYTL